MCINQVQVQAPPNHPTSCPLSHILYIPLAFLSPFTRLYKDSSKDFYLFCSLVCIQGLEQCLAWVGTKESVVNGCVNEWPKGYMNAGLHECRTKWTCKGINSWMNAGINVCMCAEMHEWMQKWMHGCMGSWKNVGIHECVHEWMYGRTHWMMPRV